MGVSCLAFAIISTWKAECTVEPLTQSLWICSQALKRLTVALSTSNTVQIHGDMVVEPANQLVAAARATFQYLLSTFAFTDKVSAVRRNGDCRTLSSSWT